jgi:peroxiredoxin
MTAMNQTVQPGDAAPDFVLPAVQSDRVISLSDYRHRSALFLGLFRGLYCPFCRRAIAHMAASAEKLKALGIESLDIVATDLENARLYYQFRPLRLDLVVDPELSTHRSYGVPKPAVTPEFLRSLEPVRLDGEGELPAPLPIHEAQHALDAIDGFKPTAVDIKEKERQFPQLEGQFLIDRGGIVRWVNVECAKDGVAGLGRFPAFDELRSAAHITTSV